MKTFRRRKNLKFLFAVNKLAEEDCVLEETSEIRVCYHQDTNQDNNVDVLGDERCSATCCKNKKC